MTPAESERQVSWALLSNLARLRAAPAGQPGVFPAAVEAAYQELRADFELLKRQAEAGVVDLPAHERFRLRARALLHQVEE